MISNSGESWCFQSTPLRGKCSPTDFCSELHPGSHQSAKPLCLDETELSSSQLASSKRRSQDRNFFIYENMQSYRWTPFTNWQCAWGCLSFQFAIGWHNRQKPALQTCFFMTKIQWTSCVTMCAVLIREFGVSARISLQGLSRSSPAATMIHNPGFRVFLILSTRWLSLNAWTWTCISDALPKVYFLLVVFYGKTFICNSFPAKFMEADCKNDSKCRLNEHLTELWNCADVFTGYLFVLLWESLLRKHSLCIRFRNRKAMDMMILIKINYQRIMP